VLLHSGTDNQRKMAVLGDLGILNAHNCTCPYLYNVAIFPIVATVLGVLSQQIQDRYAAMRCW
jgi:hypothetical protein